jgi:hypothetical protein
VAALGCGLLWLPKMIFGGDLRISREVGISAQYSDGVQYSTTVPDRCDAEVFEVVRG